MATAIVTGTAVLVGVIVGGLLNTYLSQRTERTRENAAARVGARLVREDLILIGARLNAVVSTGIYGPEVEPNKWFSTETWMESRPLLAAALTDEEWQDVATGFRNVERLRVIVELVAPPLEPPRATDDLRDADRQAYAETNTAVVSAYRVLDEFLKRSARSS